MHEIYGLLCSLHGIYQGCGIEKLADSASLVYTLLVYKTNPLSRPKHFHHLRLFSCKMCHTF